MTRVAEPIACPGTVPIVTDVAPHPAHTGLPAYVVQPPVGPGTKTASVQASMTKCQSCNGKGWLPQDRCPDCGGLGRVPVR